MRFYRSFIVGLLFAGSVVPLHADAASKHQKIEDLFKIIQIERTIDQMSAQQLTVAKQVMKTMLPDGAMSASDQKEMDAFLGKVVSITQEVMNWQKIEPQFVDLYASTYSEEEIDGILAFYRSPTGQSMIAKQPELLTKSQAISQAQLIALQPKLKEAFMEFARELSEKHAQK